MPELHLKQPKFTSSACGSFTKHQKRIKKFKETDMKYTNKLDKACFICDAVYTDSKDLAKKTCSDKVLKQRTYKIAINLNMMDIKKDDFC